MSEKSRHHCVSNIATLRNKGELLLLNHQLFNYCVTGKKYTYTVTYLGSLVTQYPYTQIKNRHSFIIIEGESSERRPGSLKGV